MFQKGDFFMKNNLSLLGALAILIITIVNFATKDEVITGIIGGILFILLLVLNIVSRKRANNDST
ncbi:hypothetical protein KM890_15955 [Bacillus altitudinis]|nr:hypothetical protein BAIE_18225 [Bacillus altitudinis]KQL39146.1 hypothetical protein AN962_16645 [Bacillus sp. FJAT-21955]MBU8654462.1 hypothetical protein [Bacillus altitudinis]MBU8779931.1 hypothetical protein [Bacillus altitudinis]NMF14986.1 hypothetical protein [Bacillus altitudinis]